MFCTYPTFHLCLPYKPLKWQPGLFFTMPLPCHRGKSDYFDQIVFLTSPYGSCLSPLPSSSEIICSSIFEEVGAEV